MAKLTVLMLLFLSTVSFSRDFQSLRLQKRYLVKIKIENVVYDNAETAIFVRGLPEMNIREILLENISVRSKAGLV